jgi:hypothetical protein
VLEIDFISISWQGHHFVTVRVCKRSYESNGYDDFEHVCYPIDSGETSLTTQTMTDNITVPEEFGTVETGVYRSSLPNEQHFSFLQTLSIKTFLFLSQEIPVKSLRTFLTNEKIQLVRARLVINYSG